MHVDLYIKISDTIKNDSKKQSIIIFLHIFCSYDTAFRFHEFIYLRQLGLKGVSTVTALLSSVVSD